MLNQILVQIEDLNTKFNDVHMPIKVEKIDTG